MSKQPTNLPKDETEALALSLRPCKRRGQALLEFALVAPLFFFVVLAGCQLFVWTYDQQILARSVRVGATAGNEAMSPINYIFGVDPHLATPYIPGVSDAVFADLTVSRGCREAINQITQSATANNLNPRLGWDWGCLYDPLSGALLDGTNTNTIGPSPIAGPLTKSVQAAYNEFKNDYIGPFDSGTISSCYATWNINSQTADCVYEFSLTFTKLGANYPMTITNSFATTHITTTSAPSFLVLTMHVKALSLQGTPAMNFNSSTTQVLNRFITSCPAPKDPAAYQPGYCGSTY
jgi:hypothetical protein